MAILLSLVQTCRAMEIDPEQYLEDIFKRLLDPAQKLEKMFPDQWLAARDLAGAGNAFLRKSSPRICARKDGACFTLTLRRSSRL